MKRGRPLCLLLLLAVILTLSACTGGPSVQSSAGQTGPRAVSVEVATVGTGNISQVLSYSGNLQPKQSVTLTALESGRVESVPVKIGEAVKAGDTLVVLEKDALTVQLKQAQAGLETAKIKLDQMSQPPRAEELIADEAEVTSAQAALDSATDVSAEKRTVSAANMENAEVALKQAQANYDQVASSANVSMLPQSAALQQATINYQSAVASYKLDVNPTEATLAPLRSALAQAEYKLALLKKPYEESDFALARVSVEDAQAAVDQAQLNLDNTVVRAPFDGTVADVTAVKGSLATQQSGLVQLISNDEEVLFDVEESRIGLIQNGQAAALRVATYPNKDFPALVTTVAPSADSQSHTFTVRVTPQDDKNLLRSGMYAAVSILAQEKKNVLLCPQSALVDEGDHKAVYVVKDGTAERRTVSVGLTGDDQVQVLSGLAQGEQVVTAGQTDLADKVQVSIVSAAAASD